MLLAWNVYRSLLISFHFLPYNVKLQTPKPYSVDIEVFHPFQLPVKGIRVSALKATSIKTPTKPPIPQNRILNACDFELLIKQFPKFVYHHFIQDVVNINICVLFLYSFLHVCTQNYIRRFEWFFAQKLFIFIKYIFHKC